MHLRESQKQVVTNTLAFFAEDPKRRAIDENGCCLMKTHDGRQCAIGRHIPARMHNDFGELLFHAGIADEMWACPDLAPVTDHLDGILPFPVWEILQHWHDNSGNFDSPTMIKQSRIGVWEAIEELQDE